MGSEPRRILYMEGEPRWEYKFIRQAEEDDRMVQIASIVRTTENKFYRQGIADPKELAGRLSHARRGPVRLPGIDHRLGGSRLFHARASRN